MPDDAWQAFNDRVTWDGSLHVDCRQLTAALEPPELAHLEELDAGVLATLGTLAEHGNETRDEDTPTALISIDAKLDVLLEMFNRYLLGQLELPPRRVVRFNARGILIHDWNPPVPDARLMVRMHFDGCLGLPLEIPGHAAPAPSAGAGFVTFERLSDGVRASIERLVFRQHRRLLADSRREGPSPA